MGTVLIWKDHHQSIGSQCHRKSQPPLHYPQAPVHRVIYAVPAPVCPECVACDATPWLPRVSIIHTSCKLRWPASQQSKQASTQANTPASKHARTHAPTLTSTRHPSLLLDWLGEYLIGSLTGVKWLIGWLVGWVGRWVVVVDRLVSWVGRWVVVWLVGWGINESEASFLPSLSPHPLTIHALTLFSFT